METKASLLDEYCIIHEKLKGIKDNIDNLREVAKKHIADAHTLEERNRLIAEHKEKIEAIKNNEELRKEINELTARKKYIRDILAPENQSLEQQPQQQQQQDQLNTKQIEAYVYENIKHDLVREIKETIQTKFDEFNNNKYKYIDSETETSSSETESMTDNKFTDGISVTLDKPSEISNAGDLSTSDTIHTIVNMYNKNKGPKPLLTETINNLIKKYTSKHN